MSQTEPSSTTADISDTTSKEFNKDNQKALFDYGVLPIQPRPSLPRKMPKPHRCNDHLEDVIQGISYEPREFLGPFKIWMECVQSHEGEEPSRFQLKNGRNF